jgi:hypothetical protein
MPKEEFRELTNLLESADFRNQSGNGGGLIRQEAEAFAAEIPSGVRWHNDGHGSKWFEPETRYVPWLNADGKSPFPTPIAEIVDCLKPFEPTNAKRFEKAEFPDVCPSLGLSRVQPTIAENLRPGFLH